jgi:hypothetical protein
MTSAHEKIDLLSLLQKKRDPKTAEDVSFVKIHTLLKKEPLLCETAIFEVWNIAQHIKQIYIQAKEQKCTYIKFICSELFDPIIYKTATPTDIASIRRISSPLPATLTHTQTLYTILKSFDETDLLTPDTILKNHIICCPNFVPNEITRMDWKPRKNGTCAAIVYLSYP